MTVTPLILACEPITDQVVQDAIAVHHEHLSLSGAMWRSAASGGLEGIGEHGRRIAPVLRQAADRAAEPCLGRGPGRALQRRAAIIAAIMVVEIKG